MELTVIKPDVKYEQYLDWVDELFDKKVTPHSFEGKQVEVALLLIKEYEDRNYPISFPPQKNLHTSEDF